MFHVKHDSHKGGANAPPLLAVPFYQRNTDTIFNVVVKLHFLRGSRDTRCLHGFDCLVDRVREQADIFEQHSTALEAVLFLCFADHVVDHQLRFLDIQPQFDNFLNGFYPLLSRREP